MHKTSGEIEKNNIKREREREREREKGAQKERKR